MRPPYLDTEIEQAKAKGYDIVQLKYDGWFCRADGHHGVFDYYSETDRVFSSSSSFGFDGCVFLGEFMRGTQWSQHPKRTGRFFVFDVLKLFGDSLQNETYAARYGLLRRLKLPSTFERVECFRIEDVDAVWQRFVLQEGFEGVVFRRATSKPNDAVLRCKREYTLDGVVTGWVPGVGKHEGRLGSLTVMTAKGAIVNIGTGFSDAERDAIVANWPQWLGATVEFTANAIFESGNVRHARFVRRRDDKS